MSPAQTKLVMFLAVNGLVMTGLAALGLVGYVFGPCLEPYVAGYIVRINKPDQVWRGYVTRKESRREVEVVAFRLHDLKKLAPGIPRKYTFDAEAKLSEKIPTSAYLCDPERQSLGEDLGTHPVGTVWSRSYCFEMPGTIADTQAIRVSGHAEHTRIVAGVRWPFWYSTTPVPEFTVWPTHCYRDDGSVDTKSAGCVAP